MTGPPHDPRKGTHLDVDTEVVRRLIDEQFPEWCALPITAVPRQGNDNRTFRLGDDLAVRLPSHERYVAGITKEDTVLTRDGSITKPASLYGRIAPVFEAIA